MMDAMTSWFKFFFLGFFSHGTAKDGARRGYTNVFLGFVLALTLLWSGLIGSEMLPFGVHYGSSSDFKATVHAVLANADADKRIDAKIEDGMLKVKKRGGEYAEALFVNTFERETDKQDYSGRGYDVVVDTRPAGTLAEIEAYCVSNDGKNTEISYQDYLSLSDVARLNFDFKLRYTGNALELTDELVAGYLEYLSGSGDENRSAAEKLAVDLSEEKITREEYRRAIYELYFKSFYPDITAYESTSEVPLLRNYYYHKYISTGSNNYLFIFDDYMTGSFETDGGVPVSFHGFYGELENGTLIAEAATQDEACASVDDFVRASVAATAPLNSYVHATNIISLLPFIALMLMVAALLTYSILKLRSVESIRSLGAMLKIVGSFVWFSGAISAVLTVAASFFLGGNIIGVLPLIVFFAVLVVRSVIFAAMENRAYISQLKQEEVEQTEV